MKIDTYWEDVTGYLIEILTTDNIKHSRIIVLPTDLPELSVRTLIKQTLPNAKEILCLDQLSGALTPKADSPLFIEQMSEHT